MSNIVNFRRFLTEISKLDLPKAKEEREKFEPSNYNNVSRLHDMPNGHHVYVVNHNTKKSSFHTPAFLFVHPKTKNIDVKISGMMKTSKNPNTPRILSNIDLHSTEGNEVHAHDAYAHLYHHGIMSVHDKMSPGAIKVGQKIRQHHPDVVSHSYDYEKGEAKPAGNDYAVDTDHHGIDAKMHGLNRYRNENLVRVRFLPKEKQKYGSYLDKNKILQ